jgi:DNA adenine methylase
MRGPLAYIGGKRAVAKQIVEMLPEHHTYAEIFAGGAQVFFAKPPSAVEILNDLDGELIGFYRVIQRHYEELIRYMRFTIVSRKYYELLKAMDPESLTDIQRAARFLFLQKTSYAGRVTKQNFRTAIVQPPSLNPERLPELIEETHHRLARVVLECLPYEKMLAKYDSKETLFFVDPPYYGVKHYKFNLDPIDFQVLAERLKKIDGKFLLTLNDVPQVREIFAGFRIRGIEMPYTAQKVAGRRFHEVVIVNF